MLGIIEVVATKQPLLSFRVFSQEIKSKEYNFMFETAEKLELETSVNFLLILFCVSFLPFQTYYSALLHLSSSIILSLTMKFENKCFPFASELSETVGWFCNWFLYK